MTAPISYPLLDLVDSPADLKQLNLSQLPQFAEELRRYLIASIATCGGHFAAGLGTVELTTALHYVYDTPYDRLVWDVGHQCYPHKILTGRRDRIESIRQQEGLAPFLKMSESEYDAFGAGHSSTSISAALGMAVAAMHKGESRKAVAIIGDGGMTAGLAYEALDHGGTLPDADLLVVLNDNEMSISPNVGALSAYLTRMMSGRLYSMVRESGKRVLEHLPPVLELAKRTERHVKGMVVPGSLFEDLGFQYFGPVDGHDVISLAQNLSNLRDIKGPRLLHVVTRKGKGYSLAEADPVKYHAVSKFNPAHGVAAVAATNATKPTYTQVFGQWLCDMAAVDNRLVAITPAMREGSGLVAFSERFAERYFDVGIAEQHSVTFAAGLAAQGLKPVVAIYSTFLQRAYDQVIHDVVIQKLPVLFAIDRAGLVGPDGPTHAGSFDFNYLRCLPDMVIMAPADENECRQMLSTGFSLDGPAAVRYPRGSGPGVAVAADAPLIPIGKAEIRRRGQEILILAFGAVLEACLEVAEQLDATVVNMRFVKPLDEPLLLELAALHTTLVTVEENAVAGGAGSAVNETLLKFGLMLSVLNLGIPDAFIEHGSRDQVLAMAGLNAHGIHRAIATHLGRSISPAAVAT